MRDRFNSSVSVRCRGGRKKIDLLNYCGFYLFIFNDFEIDFFFVCLFQNPYTLYSIALFLSLLINQVERSYCFYSSRGRNVFDVICEYYMTSCVPHIDSGFLTPANYTQYTGKQIYLKKLSERPEYF